MNSTFFLAKLKQHKQDLREHENQLTKDLSKSDLLQKLTSLESQFQHQLDQVTKQNLADTQKLSKHQSKLSQLQSLSTELQSSLQSLCNSQNLELTSLKSQFQSDLDLKQQTILQLLDKIKDLQNQIKEFRSQNRLNMQQMIELQSQQENQHKQITEQNLKKMGLDQEIDQLSGNNLERQRDLQLIDKDIDKLFQDLAKKEAQIRRNQEEAQAITEQINRIEQTIESMEPKDMEQVQNAVDEIEKQIQEALQQESELSQKLNKLQETSNANDQKLKDLITQNEQLTLHKSNNDTKFTLLTFLNHLDLDTLHCIAKLQSLAPLAKLHNEQLSPDLSTSLTSLQDHINQLKQELQLSEPSHTKAKDSLSELQTKGQQLQLQLSKLQTSVKHSESKLSIVSDHRIQELLTQCEQQFQKTNKLLNKDQRYLAVNEIPKLSKKSQVQEQEETDKLTKRFQYIKEELKKDDTMSQVELLQNLLKHLQEQQNRITKARSPSPSRSAGSLNQHIFQLLLSPDPRGKGSMKSPSPDHKKRENEQQIKELQERLRDAEEDINQMPINSNSRKALEEQIEELQDRLNDYQQNDDRNPLELENIDNDIFDLECELKRLKALQHKLNQDNLTKQQAQAKLQLDKLNQIMTSIDHEMQKAEDELKAIEDENSQIQEDIEYKIEVEDKLKQQMKELKDRKDKLRKEREKIERGLQDIENKAKSNQLSYDSLINEVRQINSSLNQASQDAEHMHDYIGALNKKLQGARSTFKTKRDLLAQCNSQLKIAQSKLAVIDQTLKSNDTQLSLIESLLSDLPNDHPQKFQFTELYTSLKDNLLQQQSLLSQLTSQLQDKAILLSQLSVKLISGKDLKPILKDLQQINFDLDQLSAQLQKNLIDQEWNIDSLKKALDDELKNTQDALIKEITNKFKQIESTLGKEFQGPFEQTQELIKECLQMIASGLAEEKPKQSSSSIGAMLIEYNENVKAEHKEVQQMDKEDRQNLINNLQHLHNVFKQMRSKNFGKPQELQDLLSVLSDLCSSSTSLLSLLTTQHLPHLQDLHDSLSSLLSQHKESLQHQTLIDTVLLSSSQQLYKLQSSLSDCNDLALQLENLLQEMHSGATSDCPEYQAKAAQIEEWRQIVNQSEASLRLLDNKKESLAAKLQEIQRQKEEASNNVTKLKGINEEAIEIEKQLRSTNGEVGLINTQKLQSVRKDIADAEVMKVKNRCIKQIANIEKKMMDLIQGIDSLKPKRIGHENEQELQSKIAYFKKHIYNQAGQVNDAKKAVNSIQQAKLTDLKSLCDQVKTLVGASQQINKILNDIEKFEEERATIEDTSAQIEEQQQIEDLSKKNLQQLKKLEKIKAKLDVIGKGAQDCDGYTSNQEEADFIETILGEFPELLDKHQQAKAICENVNNLLSRHNPSDLKNVSKQLQANDQTISYLEDITSQLEEQFINMDIEAKLAKRKNELEELKSICEDFSDKLLDLKKHLVNDLDKIRERKDLSAKLQSSSAALLDENGNPVNILEELNQVQDELQTILQEVFDMTTKNQDIKLMRDQAAEEFETFEKARRKQGTAKDIFWYLKVNGETKKKIVKLIKQLKDISRRIKETKAQYQQVRNKLEKTRQTRKLYKAVVGDVVDELFAEYINRLGCMVPIRRIDNNQYYFGTKKICAKIINGKLVIRVGGGYMGIEEFMMYYGQQELQKIQKEEHISLIQEDLELFNDDDIKARMITPRLDLGKIQNKILHDQKEPTQLLQVPISEKRTSMRHRSPKRPSTTFKIDNDQEESKSHRATIVGIGDVRRALKQNVQQSIQMEETKHHHSVSVPKQRGFHHARSTMGEDQQTDKLSDSSQQKHNFKPHKTIDQRSPKGGHLNSDLFTDK